MAQSAARQSHNLKVVSSSLTRGKRQVFYIFVVDIHLRADILYVPAQRLFNKFVLRVVKNKYKSIQIVKAGTNLSKYIWLKTEFQANCPVHGFMENIGPFFSITLTVSVIPSIICPLVQLMSKFHS